MSAKSSGMPIDEQRQRLKQLYRDLRTARLNEIYYTKQLASWTRYNGVNDLLIALGAAGSPIAAWKASALPSLRGVWIGLSVFTFVLAVLKPTLSLHERLKTYAELRSHYCELVFVLRDIATEAEGHQGFSVGLDKQYATARRNIAKLASVDPWEPRRAMLIAIQASVNQEMPASGLWLPNG